MSKLYVIGVGVGDKNALTLKAIETLKKIDVLYCPTSKANNESIAFSIAKDFLKEDVVIKNRHFPMVKDFKKMDDVFLNIANDIKTDVLEGKNVGFVTIGDSMIYSTFIYVLEKIKDDIQIKTISGIPSFVDVASKINFPIAFDDMPFLVVPATVDIKKLEEYIRDFESIVIMKAYKNYETIVNLIKKYNLQNNTVIISNSSRDKEKIIIRDDIFIEKNEEYLTTILINKRWNL